MKEDNPDPTKSREVIFVQDRGCTLLFDLQFYSF